MEKDLKVLVFTNEQTAYEQIAKALQDVKEIRKVNLDEESLSTVNLLGFDFIIIYSDANKLLSKDSFIQSIKAKYPNLFYIPIIVLLDSEDLKYVKDIADLREISFCLTLDFSQDIFIELFNDVVQTTTIIGRTRKKLINKNFRSETSDTKNASLCKINSILIVDDDPMMIKILKKCMEKLGVKHIFTTNNGSDALACAINNKIDVILLDVMMPELDGIQVLKLLKKLDATKDIDIIVVSSKVNVNILCSLVKLGIKDYISKPFTQSVVLEKLAYLKQM